MVLYRVLFSRPIKADIRRVFVVIEQSDCADPQEEPLLAEPDGIRVARVVWYKNLQWRITWAPMLVGDSETFWAMTLTEITLGPNRT
jgi:hypothetical protein